VLMVFPYVVTVGTADLDDRRYALSSPGASTAQPCWLPGSR